MTNRTEERGAGPRNASELPIVDPSDLGVDPRSSTCSCSCSSEDERDGSIVGVVLAAGTSSRFGGANKLLVDLDGRPLVRHAAVTLLRSRVNRVLVVLGHEADRVREALDGLDVEVVTNADYETGQATSVRIGVRGARERGAQAVVIALGDMPRVGPDTVDVLLEAYSAGVGDALAAAYEGRRGNPVLFDQRYFDTLCGVSGDVGGRRILLESDDARLVETGDRGILRDVDTKTDLDSVEQ